MVAFELSGLGLKLWLLLCVGVADDCCCVVACEVAFAVVCACAVDVAVDVACEVVVVCDCCRG